MGHKSNKNFKNMGHFFWDTRYYIRLRALLYLGCMPYSVVEKVQIFALQLKLFKFLKLWQGASISHFVRLLIGR